MDPQASFDHVVRSIGQVVLDWVRQYPKHRLARVDTPLLISAFSQVVDGVRVGATPWPMGGGWSGNDTKLGTKYQVLPEKMSPKQLDKIHNSDADTDAPYGNENLRGHPQKWTRWNEKISQTIPICVAAHVSKFNDIDANPHIRRSE